MLTLGAMVMGLPRSRIDELLEVVALTGMEAKRRVGDYSLGMRQRLGIARALLGDPEVLVLDEPANGLDPAGIRWRRGLLRSFAELGGTVLLAEHVAEDDSLIVEASTEQVGRAAPPPASFSPSCVPQGLRPQEMFLQLTADDTREEVSA